MKDGDMMARSAEHYQELKDNRRQDILKAALPLFAIQGYDSVSIDDIVKACGCSHGLFYHYFSSKNDLFKAMMEESKTASKRCYPREWLNDQRPVEGLHHFVDQIINLLLHDEENCYYMYFYLTMHFQRTLPKTQKKGEKKHFPHMLEDMIIKGQNENTFLEGDPFEMTRLFIATLRGLFYERLQVGIKKFHCPHKKLILRILIKEEYV